eukprot:m.484686 g.484686  ORF g.484686 m.484686 type:complete len:86 (+) comp69921_c0_seq1:347-604(+)
MPCCQTRITQCGAILISISTRRMCPAHVVRAIVMKTEMRYKEAPTGPADVTSPTMLVVRSGKTRHTPQTATGEELSQIQPLKREV